MQAHVHVSQHACSDNDRSMYMHVLYSRFNLKLRQEGRSALATALALSATETTPGFRCLAGISTGPLEHASRNVCDYFCLLLFGGYEFATVPRRQLSRDFTRLVEIPLRATRMYLIKNS